MDHLTLAIIGIYVLFILLGISVGKLTYWKGQAKFYKMMRDAAMDHADGLSERILQQSKYIEELRAERDAAILSAQEPWVSVSDSAKKAPETQDSATVSAPPEYPPKYPDGQHYIHTWDGQKVKV